MYVEVKSHYGIKQKQGVVGLEKGKAKGLRRL